jgi:3-oxoacyl-[acyl-carrier-protein] synthase II
VRRVVITGVGVICPLGSTKESLWEALRQGRSGVSSIYGLAAPIAGQSLDFTGGIEDFGELVPEAKKAIRKGVKLMCRECQMGVAAAQRALADSKFASTAETAERSGVVFASDYMLSVPDELTAAVRACTDPEHQFHFHQWGPTGMPQITPLWLLKYLPNMPASHVAIYNDLRGPNNSLTLREAGSNLAVAEAFRTIARGHADMMIAGACGTRIQPMKALHAAQTEEVAGNGQPAETASRPFDLNRSGMVLGEGAAAIVLEELESARARGAKVIAEIVGAGSSSVADPNLVARRDVAVANAIRAALRDANASTDEVGHIHAHGLSTRTADADEARGIREVFGPRTDELPVAASKSYFGNLGAGSGLVELVTSLLAIEHRWLPPVLNYKTPDPECKLLVSDGKASPGRSFVKVSFTPQGQAAALYLRAFE